MIGQFFAGYDHGDYSIGPCDTKTEAYKQFFEEYPDADKIVIGESDEHVIKVDGDAFLEMIRAQNEDALCDEVAEDFEEWSKAIPMAKATELGHALTIMFHHWLKRNGRKISLQFIKEVETRPSVRKGAADA